MRYAVHLQMDTLKESIVFATTSWARLLYSAALPRPEGPSSRRQVVRKNSQNLKAIGTLLCLCDYVPGRCIRA